MDTSNWNTDNRIGRRQWLQSAGMIGSGLFAAGMNETLFTGTAKAGPLPAAAGKSECFVPIRSITRGPNFHWFGYYDKFQTDPTGRFALGMETSFDFRNPTADDVVKIGMIDLEDGDRWIEVGESKSWSWQQGCMLQWRPGTSSEILWNDRQKGRFVCHILDVKTGKKRTVEHPIYYVSPDGKTALTLDFERLHDLRPCCGYCGVPDRYRDLVAPEDSGIYKLDLETGKKDLIITIGQISKLGTIPDPDPYAKHYFNHLEFNPDGSRFVFLHLWKYPNGKRKCRMLTATPEGKDIYIVDKNGKTSHFIWRGTKHLIAESHQKSHGFTLYQFEDRANHVEPVNPEVFNRSQHFTHVPGGEWIINDTSPDPKTRLKRIFLYHLATRKVVTLGDFYTHPQYTGDWRNDAHTRVSRDGAIAIFDSVHGGEGRQMYLLDLREATAKL